jgi:hypothetical protein
MINAMTTATGGASKKSPRQVSTKDKFLEKHRYLRQSTMACNSPY